MGCSSSTEVVTDPITGETKTKHTLGGAYPGNRRQANAPYMPPQSEFTKVDGHSSQAVQHFVQYGGGNALVLQNGPAPPKPQQGGGGGGGGGGGKQYISVTLPPGVKAGDKIHVRAPDGRLNEIYVPSGMGPGSTFTVEFADARDETPSAPPPTPPMAVASVYDENKYSTATSSSSSTTTTAAAPYDPYKEILGHDDGAIATTDATAYTAGGTAPTSTSTPGGDGFASDFGKRF